MSEKYEAVVVEISRLKIEPGDIIVFRRTRGKFQPEEFDEINDLFSHHIKEDVPYLLLDEHTLISIVSAGSSGRENDGLDDLYPGDWPGG